MCLQFINQPIIQCESVLDAVLFINYDRESVCSLKIVALSVFFVHFKCLTDAFLNF